MNTNIPVLSLELLASFHTEGNTGRELPNVLIYDPLKMMHIECDVWIYPKGVYLHDEECFIFTDIASDKITHDRLMKQRERTCEEVDYGKYIRHLRIGTIRGVGKAILARSEVQECLRTKRYHVG